MPHACRIASGASRPQDRPEVAAGLVQSLELDCLVLAYLSEEVLVRQSHRRVAEQGPGYLEEFLPALAGVSPALYLQPQLKVATSAGGFDPRRCAEAAAQVLTEHGSGELSIAAVRGDNLLDRLEELLAAGCLLANRKTGQPLLEARLRPRFAHAWLGGTAVTEALDEGARLVITGTTPAASLAAGVASFVLDWRGSPLDRLASAAAGGNLLEAGSRTLRGLSLDGDLPAVVPGWPIVEIATDGTLLLSSFPAEASQLNRAALKTDLAQPLATPEVTVDTSQVKITKTKKGPPGFTVSGIRGTAPAEEVDVTIGLAEGYEARALLVSKANPQRIEDLLEVLRQRVGSQLAELTYQPLTAGCGELHAHAAREEPLARLLAELEAINQLSPFGKWQARCYGGACGPRLRLWRTTIPKELIEVGVDCRIASEWM